MKWYHLRILALLTILSAPGCDGGGDEPLARELYSFGPGDCSSSDVLGTWRQMTTVEGSGWNREDMTFLADCSVTAQEYEGRLGSDSGYFRQDGAEIQIDLATWADRRAELVGGTLKMYSGDHTVILERQTGPGGDEVLCYGDETLAINRTNVGIVPPAGVQVRFRVLTCLGEPVRELEPADVVILNDEKGEPFGAGGEGGSVSDLAPPSNFALFTVLALDMSDSIAAAGARDDVIDGALRFVDLLVRQPEQELKHAVAVVAFGRPDEVELVQDFTRDPEDLDRTLEQLRSAPSRGTTDLYGAYMKSLELVAGEGSTTFDRLAADADLIESFVVLLTDGTHEAGDEENLRTQALDARQSYMTALNTSIYSIGIKGSFDESRLRELASQPKNYVQAENASELQSTFEEIATRVAGIARSNYVVGVCTPVALGNPSLTIRITVDGLRGEKTISYDVDQLDGDLSQCDPAEVASAVASIASGPRPEADGCAGEAVRCPDGRCVANIAECLSDEACDEAGGEDCAFICTDTCAWEADEACDDGGPGSEYGLCAYGSDCTDCGPRPVM